MRRTLLLTLLFTTVCMAGTLVVLAGDPCPEQEFQSLDGWNAAMIADDPVSGQKLRLKGSVAYTHTATVITGWCCDDDADQTLTLRRLDTGDEIPIDPNDGTYRFTVRYTTPGTKMVDLALTDDIATRIGTKPIFVHDNRPPILY